ncbi:MAG: adenylate/guanylate cyclase domain-containing protein [Proteobacteria bacterium]|nr:adenylate/guanylate cyclase domain-containing protein [Pseudomonadota bacterium]
MSHEQFDQKYLRVVAVLVLDLTGFTEAAARGGCIASFLRILDGQKVCLPVLREAKAEFVRTFADDMVALFAEPGAALDAALEIHRRTARFEPAPGALERAECCIGVGYGPIYAIGPNHAMGDEMNRTSKLGEDTARGGEILVTEGARAALEGREDMTFEAQTSDDLIFPYFKVVPAPTA